jgi:hypothetical protein
MQSSKSRQLETQSPCWNSRLTAVLWELEDGGEADEQTDRLTLSFGRAVARPMVDIASARLWFAQGFLAGEIQTMLEARRRAELSPSECRAYVIDVLLVVRQAMATESGQFNSHRKETHHAAA